VNVLDPLFEGVLRPYLVLFDRTEPVPMDLELRDAGVDSLALIELLVSVEQAFEIEIPDEMLVSDTFKTPGSLWSTISKLRQHQG
jgi:acyl carrier protein